MLQDPTPSDAVYCLAAFARGSKIAANTGPISQIYTHACGCAGPVCKKYAVGSTRGKAAHMMQAGHASAQPARLAHDTR